MYASEKYLNERFTAANVVPKMVKTANKAIEHSAYNRLINFDLDGDVAYIKITISDLFKYISERVKNNNKDCSLIEDEEDKEYCKYFEIVNDIKIYKKFISKCSFTEDPTACKMRFKENIINLELKKQEIIKKINRIKLDNEKYVNATQPDKGVKYYNEILPSYRPYINDSYNHRNVLEVFNPSPRNKTGSYVNKLIRDDYKSKFKSCKKMKADKEILCRYGVYQQLISDLKTHILTCKTNKCVQTVQNAINSNTQKAMEIYNKLNTPSAIVNRGTQ